MYYYFFYNSNAYFLIVKKKKSFWDEQDPMRTYEKRCDVCTFIIWSKGLFVSFYPTFEVFLILQLSSPKLLRPQIKCKVNIKHEPISLKRCCLFKVGLNPFYGDRLCDSNHPAETNAWDYRRMRVIFLWAEPTFKWWYSSLRMSSFLFAVEYLVLNRPVFFLGLCIENGLLLKEWCF